LKIKWPELIISIAISLVVGFLAGIFTSGSMGIYNNLTLPPLSPPSIVFPIVWTILYILMGISAYLIYVSDASKESKKNALTIYAIQLLMNFAWSIIFFNLNAYLISFVWLVGLWMMIVLMIISFYKINKTAAYLHIPYLIWVTFAGYLNLSIYLLNK